MPKPVKLHLPRLHPGQLEIKAAATRFNVINCGRRWGKDILCQDLLVETALAGKPVAWYSPDYKSLLEVWFSLKRILRPLIGRSDYTQKRIELYGGGVIEMWALDSDPECSRGRKYARIIVNEAAKVRHLQRAWEESLRPSLADFRGDAFFPSTPRGRNYYWELWRRGDPDNPDREEGWTSWQRPTVDNPYIAGDEIEAMRRELPTRTFNQEILAQFLEIAGRFFEDFDPDKHVILDKDIPRFWRVWGSLDWGQSAPFAFYLHASDEAGNVHTFGECYEAGITTQEQASQVVAMLKAKGLPVREVMIAADSAIFPPKDPAQRLGEYPAETYWRAGLNVVPAVKNRLAGWAMMKNYLHRPGGWSIHKGACPNLIRTLPLMQYDERHGHEDDMDTTLEDHACDAVRYGFMTRPKGSVDPSVPVPVSVRPPDYSPAWMKKTKATL